MLRSLFSRALLIILTISSLTGIVQATDILLSHQGRLLDSGDQPITGSRTVTFRLYESALGGAPLWTEVHTGVQISDGLFDVILGSVVALSTDILAPSGASPERWLSLQIEPDTDELQPRRRITAAPFAAASKRVTGDIVTAPGSLAIADLNSDGRIDMVVSPESTYTAWVQDNSPNTEHFARLKVMDASSQLNLNHPDASSMMLANSAGGGIKLGGMSGSTTGTIRMVASPDSATDYRDVDSDGDGIPESSDRRTVSANDVHHNVISRSGSTTGTIRMMVSPDSAVSTLEHDSDGDGVSETTDRRTVSVKYFQDHVMARSGSTTGTIRMMASPDSAGSTLANDADGDGNPECVQRGVVTGQAPGTSNVTATYLEVDENDDGVPESSVSQTARSKQSESKSNTKASFTAQSVSYSDTASAGMESTLDTDNDGVAESSVRVKAMLASSEGTLSSRSGSTTGTIRMAASPVSTSSALETDADGNGNAESVATTETNSNGASQSLEKKGLNAINVRTSMMDSVGNAGFVRRIQWDIDNDGVYDMISSTTGDSAGARSTWKGGMSGSTTGTIRMQASPDSSKSSVESDADNDGTPECAAEAASSDKFAQVRGFSVEISGARRSSFENFCDSAGSAMRAINTKGTGATVRTMMSANDSAMVLQDCDEDNDGHAEARGIISVKSPSGSGSASSSGRMSCDSDDDGVDDVTVEMEANADSASLRLNGLPPGSPVVQRITMTATPTGVYMAVGDATCNGTNWVNASDKNAKENFQKVDGEELLKKISELDITKWNYKNDKESEHIGPTAQDFKKTFGVGSDGKSISTIDPSGIALAAIKELSKQNSELKGQNKELKKELDELKRLIKQIASKK